MLYTLISEAVNRALHKKNLSKKTTDYYDIETVADLAKNEKDPEEAAVFYSGDTYDPDDDFEYSEFDDEADA